MTPGTGAPRVALIWAQTPDGVIGADNTIPWRVPEDMAHFKKLTSGHPVVMGRRTWDSLPPRARPLPHRRNIVITRRPTWSAAGADPAASLEEALKLADADLTWIMGGGEIYRAAMAYATELVVTEVDTKVAGDAYAPTIGPDWHIDSTTDWQQSTTGLRFRWLRYLR
ncbi:dihydrofolate reductase [Nocardia wallacei]|uniref:Dihydrofolate reductase n=1 Tax=Nocardia wallacei TaxID=480035 RepID=A0A7G1KZU0_9NOCA|nr:dihydrofolate reductase [Nocardia wallacei]BCK58614.1 dihydrofolate reductase [Nocardia wallacei]